MFFQRLANAYNDGLVNIVQVTFTKCLKGYVE